MPTLKQNKSQKQDRQKGNIPYLTTLYRLQSTYGDPAAQNTRYAILAEENKVHDIPSLITELYYRWKRDPWLGGYNKYLNCLDFNIIPENVIPGNIFSYPMNTKREFKKLPDPAESLYTPKKQNGGQISMNEQELQQAFIQFLAQKTGAKNQQELEAAIQQLGEEGLKQAYAEFMQMMQQQQVQAAKFGAKLNYIKQLRGQCPEGYELQYYKDGGQLCKKCVKKQLEAEQNSPQNPIDAFKCGRKMKKKQDGGSVEVDKCGSKMKKKKCENGGFIPFDKCGKKMKKNENGGSTTPNFMKVKGK